MNKVEKVISSTEHCHIRNIYSFIREDDYNKVRDALETEHIHYRPAENSYVGLYMIEIL